MFLEGKISQKIFVTFLEEILKKKLENLKENLKKSLKYLRINGIHISKENFKSVKIPKIISKNLSKDSLSLFLNLFSPRKTVGKGNVRIPTNFGDCPNLIYNPGIYPCHATSSSQLSFSLLFWQIADCRLQILLQINIQFFHTQNIKCKVYLHFSGRADNLCFTLRI